MLFYFLSSNYGTCLYVNIRLQSAALERDAVLHSYEDNNEISGFIKRREFVDELKTTRF
jgi:hypothetical protein